MSIFYFINLFNFMLCCGLPTDIKAIFDLIWFGTETYKTIELAEVFANFCKFLQRLFYFILHVRAALHTHTDTRDWWPYPRVCCWCG